MRAFGRIAGTWALAVGLGLTGPAGTASARPPANDLRLPLFFEANEGQTDARVRFLARAPGHTLFLTPTEAALVVATSRGPAGVVRMRLLGADPAPVVSGRDELPARAHYLVGRDPAGWRTDIPTYARVVYRGVYPGVDLVYYGRQGQLEYDFVVAPGADAGGIRLAFDGLDALTLDAAGHLVLRSPGGEIRIERPVIYQEVGGARRRISGGFERRGPREVGFRLGSYDRRRALVIDPRLVYSSFLGGGGLDVASAIAVDAAGYAYVTGVTTSADFPGAGIPAGGGDAFVAKLRADGSGLVYAAYLGGSGLDVGRGIAVGRDGSVHVVGETYSADFPTVNALQSGNRSGSCGHGLCGEAFVAKLGPTGGRLVYATYVGGSLGDAAYAVAVDGAGFAYVTGSLSGTGRVVFSARSHFHPTGRGGAFVLKLAPGGSLAYSADFGVGAGYGIAVDSAGAAYVTGIAWEGFPTVNALQATFGGRFGDAFVAKLDPSGTRLVYSTYLGGSGFDQGLGIAVDGAGQAHVTGLTESPDFPVAHPLQPVCGCRLDVYDAFVAKLNAGGSALVYATFLGGRGDDRGQGIAVDASGHAYVAGSTRSSDFPIADPVQARLGGGTCIDGPCSDAFLARLDPAGARLTYATYLGGSAADEALGVTVDAAGNAYVAGFTDSGNFPTARAFQGTRRGGRDAFVAKIGPGGRRAPSFAIGPTTTVPPTAGPGSVLLIRTRVSASTAASGIIVDLEIYDTAGRRVAQRVYERQGFTPGQARPYLWPWRVPAGLPDGRYTLKVGVFDADWSTLYTWEDRAVTLTVR